LGAVEWAILAAGSFGQERPREEREALRSAEGRVGGPSRAWGQPSTARGRWASPGPRACGPAWPPTA